MDEQFFDLLIYISVITHIIRTSYEFLKYKKIIRPGRISFIIILINMILLWAAWFIMGGMAESEEVLPLMIKVLGGVLIAAGAAAFLIALFTIRSLETYKGDLITHGIYSVFRHPMYLGFILWLTGVPLFFGSFTSGVLAFFFIPNVLYWRHLEEKELLNRYSEYRSYKKKTLF